MQHFQLGLKFYRASDCAAALVELEAAYGLTRHADRLHNFHNRSWTAENLGAIPAAIDYEERSFALRRGDLSLEELDLPRGRLVRPPCASATP